MLSLFYTIFCFFLLTEKKLIYISQVQEGKKTLRNEWEKKLNKISRKKFKSNK